MNLLNNFGNILAIMSFVTVMGTGVIVVVIFIKCVIDSIKENI